MCSCACMHASAQAATKGGQPAEEKPILAATTKPILAAMTEATSTGRFCRMDSSRTVSAQDPSPQAAAGAAAPRPADAPTASAAVSTTTSATRRATQASLLPVEGVTGAAEENEVEADEVHLA